MNIKTKTLVSFSPTGTSKKILESVSCEISQGITDLVDITLPENRTTALHTSKNDLLIITIPVYMGRVPALINDWLKSIKADNTPTVCIVTYGNRVYDDALLELKDIMDKCGGKIIAAAAFIGEHSFSSKETPIAAARPDERDLKTARDFGKKIAKKLELINEDNLLSDIKVPGNNPYGGVTTLWDVDFIKVSDKCNQCGICAEVCPVGAINKNDSRSIDIKKCITCCACIKKCPENARSMKESDVKEASKRFNRLYSARKEPELFT